MTILTKTSTGVVTRKKAPSKTLTLRKLNSSKSSHSQKTTLLADISGSMNGSPLSELKRALHKVWSPAISGIAFGSDLYSFTGEDIDLLHTSGSTNMIGALREGWSIESSHIILMTDGYPDGGGEGVLQEVRRHPEPPIDTVGIGSGYAEDLLRQIASLTGGRFMDVSQPFMLTQTLEQLLLNKPRGTESPAQNGGAIVL